VGDELELIVRGALGKRLLGDVRESEDDTTWGEEPGIKRHCVAKKIVSVEGDMGVFGVPKTPPRSVQMDPISQSPRIGSEITSAWLAQEDEKRFLREVVEVEEGPIAKMAGIAPLVGALVGGKDRGFEKGDERGARDRIDRESALDLSGLQDCMIPTEAGVESLLNMNQFVESTIERQNQQAQSLEPCPQFAFSTIGGIGLTTFKSRVPVFSGENPEHSLQSSQQDLNGPQNGGSEETQGGQVKESGSLIGEITEEAYPKVYAAQKAASMAILATMEGEEGKKKSRRPYRFCSKCWCDNKVHE